MQEGLAGRDFQSQNAPDMERSMVRNASGGCAVLCKLSELAECRTAHVAGLRGERELSRRLYSMGLCPGAELCVCGSLPGMVRVRIMGTTLGLTREDAENIDVSPVE